MATWPNRKESAPRRWAKFGACANAEGPERGITMQCGRRKPVEFTWTLNKENQKNSPEQVARMKDSWLHYRPQAVNEFQKPSESMPKDPRASQPRTSSKGETNSRAGKTWSPIDEQRRRIEHQNPPGLMAPQELKKFPSKGTSHPHEKLSPQKARPWKTGSTLHTDAAEFIPQTAQSSTDAREQPVQWLNNDTHRPNESDEHPFTLPDKSAEQLPHPQHGPMDHGPMGDAFSRQSRDVGPNGLGKAGMDQDNSADNVRRNAQLIHMKTKLKEHYRLLYSKYKEYVGKRVPEKVEEYYMRLKHCQAQYMKLKYYEYKAHGMPMIRRPNDDAGGPLSQSVSAGAQQRGGPGPVPGIPPSRMENGRIPIPDNNPWQSQNARGGGGAWKDSGEFGMGYGNNNPMHNDWGGQSESMWRGGGGGGQRSKPSSYQHSQRENGGFSKYSGMQGKSMWGGDGGYSSRGNSGPHPKFPQSAEFSERRGGGGHRGGFGGPMFEPENNSYGHGHRAQDGGGWNDMRNGYQRDNRDNGRFATTANGPSSASHNPRWNS